MSTLNELIAALRAADSLKTLATSAEDGTPHVELKDWADADEQGHLVLREHGEYSRSNRNLVSSLWFKRRALLHLHAADGSSHALRLRPYKAVIAGPLFEAHYREVGSEQGLSTVWLFDVEAITDEAPEARRRREEDGRLPLQHLDRIAVV